MVHKYCIVIYVVLTDIYVALVSMLIAKECYLCDYSATEQQVLTFSF